MKNAILLLIAFLLLPSVAVANPVAQRAAATLTNRVMKTLEPRIDEMVEKATVPPAAKEEMKRQLTDAASRIVNQEIQAAMGGRLPNPAAIVNKVVGELATVSANIAQQVASGTLAGGGSSAGGSAVIMAPSGRTGASSIAPPSLDDRPFLAVYVYGHNDQTVNRFLGAEITRAFIRAGWYREAPRYEEFLTTVNAEPQRQTIHENRILELARDYGIQQIGILSMISILGTYVITAKIVNVETNETITETELDNSLAALSDIRTASEELVGKMIGAVERYVSASIRVAPVEPPPVTPPQYSQAVAHDNRSFPDRQQARSPVAETSAPVQRVPIVEQVKIEFIAAPNPVNRSDGMPVTFSIEGGEVTAWALNVLGMRGQNFNRITASASTISWDLTDRRGRMVKAGRYEISGVATLANDRRERVSVIITVR